MHEWVLLIGVRSKQYVRDANALDMSHRPMVESGFNVQSGRDAERERPDDEQLLVLL